MSDDLGRIIDDAVDDLASHSSEFDAIVCAGDMHGVAIATGIAYAMCKPLMIVCTRPHDCVVSHIQMFGEHTPETRYLYVDDMFAFGASLRYAFAYMNQSRRANIVASYEAMPRIYSTDPYTTDPTVGRPWFYQG